MATNRQNKKSSSGSSAASEPWVGTLVNWMVILTAFGTVVWYVSKFDSRIEHLEESIRGNGGLRDQLKAMDNAFNDKDGLRDQMRVLNTKVDMLDKEFLKEQQAKGAKLLKTSNVNIVRAGLLQNATFSVPYDHKATAATKQ